MVKLQPSAATPIDLLKILKSALRAAHSGSLAELETSLATILGMQDAVALSSLMRNTYAAVDAAKRRCPPGSAIVLPRYSCPSFIHGIQAAGMPHVYCDTDAETLAVQPEEVVRVATGAIGAVLIPNLFGLSADMQAIAALCRERNWQLLEGADYTFGGSFNGRPLGSFGDFAILNFQEGKALPIGGGMALSRTAGSFSHLKSQASTSSLLAIARTLAYCLLIRPWGYGLFSATISQLGIAKKRFSMEDTIRETRSEFDYTVATPRLGERISAFQGALGSSLMTVINAHVAIRNANAGVLDEALRGLPGIALVSRNPAQDRCHYIRYPILVMESQRDNLCRHLHQQGFEASPMYIEHGMRVDASLYPGAARISAELLTLPCHPLMHRRDLLRLAASVRTFFTKR
jgi:perosamine synthetase